MLSFLYSGDYELPKFGSIGLQAVHQAQLYVAAQMYQIPDTERLVVDRLTNQLGNCQMELHLSSRNAPLQTQEEMDKLVKSFKEFLRAISILHDSTPEDDSTRLYLFQIRWTFLTPVGQYRAPWVEFIRKYPDYAADALASHVDSGYTYQLARPGLAEVSAVQSGPQVHDDYSTPYGHYYYSDDPDQYEPNHDNVFD